VLHLLLLLPAAAGARPSSAAAGLSFQVTSSSAADPIRSKTLEVSAVEGAPAGANWLLLEATAGPSFSGLPAWFPLDARRSFLCLITPLLLFMWRFVWGAV
jgi:hypothetical protein